MAPAAHHQSLHSRPHEPLHPTRPRPPLAPSSARLRRPSVAALGGGRLQHSSDRLPKVGLRPPIVTDGLHAPWRV